MMLSTCLARLRNSTSSIGKYATFSTAPNTCQANAVPITPRVCAAAVNKPLLSLHECESRPVRESQCEVELPICSPMPDISELVPARCESVDSQDIAMIDVIRVMAEEEQRLGEELNQLNEKEKSYERAMQFCSNMFGNKAPTLAPENPEVTKLKKINGELLDKNNNIKDKLADAKLELKQLKEKLEGPLQRELEREKRKFIEYQCKYNEVTETGGADLRSNELNFLKEQVESVCNNVGDIHKINAEIRQEVLVLNYKCKKLEELLIKNKVEEINAIKNLAECTCKN